MVSSMGGLGSISSRMAEIAEEMGVNIRLDSTVDELVFQGKKVTGVRIGDEVLTADKVVLNAVSLMQCQQ